MREQIEAVKKGSIEAVSESARVTKELSSLAINKEIDMKEQIKKVTKVSSKAAVSVTVGGGSKCFKLTGDAFVWMGLKSLGISDYLGNKKDAMHAWIDETIEIGKALDTEQQGK